MSAPDRTLASLGRPITDSELGRDAVHIAVMPVVAAQLLQPGDHVGLVPGSTDEVMIADHNAKAIGIVDPFLRPQTLQPQGHHLDDLFPRGFVDVGTKVWVYLYPGSISSLRHVWTHKAIPNE